MKLLTRKYNLFFNSLFFSALACFAYFFLVSKAGIPRFYQDILTTQRAFFVAIILFNCVGFLLIWYNKKVGQWDPFFLHDKRKVVIHLSSISLFILILTYLTFVYIRFRAGLPRVFQLQPVGIQMVVVVWLIEIIMVGQIMINDFYRNLIMISKRASELEYRTTQSQYRALQNQLNPHFLFNNLNTLVSEIEYNPKNAAQFTRHLSDVYRYILQCSDQQTMDLRSELNFLESYVFLHRVRLGDCIFVSYDVESVYWDLKLPSLTLQLLIENVLKHNVISTHKPMDIKINVDDAERYLIISNEVRPKRGVQSSGRGLKNLSARYRLLSVKDIVVESSANCFTVKVPFLNE